MPPPETTVDERVYVGMSPERRELLDQVAEAASCDRSAFINIAIDEAIDRRRSWPVFQERLMAMRRAADEVFASLLPPVILEPGLMPEGGVVHEGENTKWTSGPDGCRSHNGVSWCVLPEGHEERELVPDCFHRDDLSRVGATAWRDTGDPTPQVTRPPAGLDEVGVARYVGPQKAQSIR